MCQIPSATTSDPNFQAIFNDTMEAYERKTKENITSHPLADELKPCTSPKDILAVLQQRVLEFDESRSANERLKWLSPTINVLCAFSATLCEGVSLVFPPAKVISAGIGVLLLAAKDVNTSQEALVNLFERIETFFKRLEIYTEVPPTTAMTSVIIKIMVEVLTILGIATKEIKKGRAKRYLKMLTGKREVEDALQRLDTLTQEEAQMAQAELLKITHNVQECVKGVDDQVQDVTTRVQVIENKVDVVIDDGRQGRAVVQHMANKVGEVERNQLRDGFRTWLSPPDPSTNHNIACDAHHKGSSEWFFQGNIFNEWKSSGSLLWIHGKPGSGKSILCSAIIQDIMTLRDAGSASVVYFYFDFRDTNKQTLQNLLHSLLIQFSARSDHCCDILSRLYSAHDHGSRKPSDGTMIDCLKEMLSNAVDGPTYIIIDALDESPDASGIPSPRELVVNLVKELVELHLPNLRICATSRHETDIRFVLECLTQNPVSLHNESGQKEDIVNYIRSVVNSDRRMRRWRDEEKNLVILTLSEKANGMFRWVFCQLELLRDCFPSSVQQILDELPESLDDTYERVLREIKKANQGHAHRLLQCLTVAVRPLRAEELAEVLAVDFNAGGAPILNPDWRWEDHEEAVLSACSTLVAIANDEDSRVVQFSHFSVKEFLTSDRLAACTGNISRYYIPLDSAHTTLAQACLGVLLRLDDRINKDSIKGFPLARYAAEHWVSHARFENVSSRVKDGMECLFDTDKPHFAVWLWVHDEEHWWDYIYESELPPRPEKPEVVPLYYAARFGLYDLVESLLMKHPEHINARGGSHGTPLHAALWQKHIEVSWLLLEHVTDADIRGSLDKTPLHVSSVLGDLEIGKCLLTHDADVNARDENNWTPLHVAAIHGHIEFVQMLLEHNAEVNAQDGHDSTPLHNAAYEGHLELAQVLLEHHAKVDARDDKGSTPLHNAAYSGHLELTQMLLKHNAEVNAQDCDGLVPLHHASKKPHLQVTRLLLEYGANVGIGKEEQGDRGHMMSRSRDK